MLFRNNTQTNAYVNDVHRRRRRNHERVDATVTDEKRLREEVVDICSVR